MIVTIFNSMARIDRSLIEAAIDGRAGRFHILTEVVIPLSKTGIALGSIFVITLVMGDFFVVKIMSGGRSASVVMSVFEDVNLLFYPPAAASAVVLLFIVTLIVSFILRLVDVRKELTRTRQAGGLGPSMSLLRYHALRAIPLWADDLHRTKRFGETVAVDSINLNIPAGAYCCLLGPSGCGKTTILRMIAGHETPISGEVRIDGDNVVGLPPIRRGTAMMFQDYALFPHLSCLDNVAFSLKMSGVAKAKRRERARALLAKVQMAPFADRVPAQLSGGQKQRIALARALITNPRVLLLDEPLSALDLFLRLQMRGQLRRMQRDLGITFIHVTHTQPEAIALADLVVVMDHGHIEQAASAQESIISRGPHMSPVLWAARTCSPVASAP